MESKIQHYLSALEHEFDIRILLACETGSRAWGFPSPDSDYDVRIIYAHKEDWYLSLFEKKDSIERMFEDNELDITGWDLKKTLGLLWKSNPPLLERIQSPIIYRKDDVFIEGISELAKSCYSKIATMHHYLSMGKKVYSEIDREDYKLKKMFYALRAAIACKWILDRDEMPPIEFKKMLETLGIDQDIFKRIVELIDLKSKASEGYLHKGDYMVLDYIDDCLAEATLKANSLPSSKGSPEKIDNFFRTMIYG